MLASGLAAAKSLGFGVSWGEFAGAGDAVVRLSLVDAREGNVFLVNKAGQAGETF